MSIGFSFEGVSCKREKSFAVLKKLADKQHLPCGINEDSAWVSFCHMGTLYFSVKDSCLSCECQTNVAGPGFHKAAIDFTEVFLRKIKLSVSIDDETEYSEHRDFERMRREHFHNWLLRIIDLIKEKLVENSEYKNLMICWDLNQYTPQEVEGSVTMSMGRFSAEKLVTRVEREGIEPFAKDFFIWYGEEKDAYFYRNQALSRLWEDCFFKPSVCSKEDESVNAYIRSNIETAAGLSSSIPLPLSEYRLLCELDGITAKLLNNPELQTDYTIGYRRGMVTHKLGNLQITLPGDFLLDTEDNHVILYDDEENWHAVRLTAFRGKEPPEFSDKLFADSASPAEEFAVENGRGKMAYAGWQEKDKCHQVIAQILSGLQVTLITVSFGDENEKEWAYAFLRGLKSDVNG